MTTYTKAPHLGRGRSGRYEIRWTEGRRSRTRSTGTADHAEAQQALADFLRDREAALKAAVDPTVAEALDAYQAEHIQPGGHDVARHRVMMRWLKAALGTRRVSSLTPGDGKRYARQRRQGKVGRPASDGTIRRELGVLQAALNYLVREHGLAADLVPQLERPRAPEAKADWLTEDQVDTLLTWFAERDAGQRLGRAHRFVVLALGTAARKGAIEQLTWPHVDLRAGLVRYDRQVRTQTRKRRAAVPIAGWLRPYLERMAEERQGDLVLDHAGDITAAFDHAMGLLARDTGDAGYASMTRHGLRHTAATLALRNGATVWQVAGLLGDTPATVMATYGHHAPDNIRGAVDSWR